MNTENNKLIAEFMEAQVTIDTYFITGMYMTISENDLKYHSDWNWLMEVVEKIESLGVNFWSVKSKVKLTIVGELAKKLNSSLYDTEFEGYDFIYTQENSKKEAVYNACVEFIKWYNQNSTS